MRSGLRKRLSGYICQPRKSERRLAVPIPSLLLKRCTDSRQYGLQAGGPEGWDALLPIIYFCGISVGVISCREMDTWGSGKKAD